MWWPGHCFLLSCLRDRTWKEQRFVVAICSIWSALAEFIVFLCPASRLSKNVRAISLIALRFVLSLCVCARTLLLSASAAAVMDVGTRHVCATIGSTAKCWGEYIVGGEISPNWIFTVEPGTSKNPGARSLQAPHTRNKRRVRCFVQLRGWLPSLASL